MDRIPASERTSERLKAICPFLTEHSYLDAERSLLAKCSTIFSSHAGSAIAIISGSGLIANGVQKSKSALGGRRLHHLRLLYHKIFFAAVAFRTKPPTSAALPRASWIGQGVSPLLVPGRAR